MDPSFRALIMKRRVGKRKGIFPLVAALGGLGLLSQIGKAVRGSGYSRKKAFSRNSKRRVGRKKKGGRKRKGRSMPRKKRYSRRGDLSQDFLDEFKDIDVEPTTTKTLARQAFDKLKSLWGNDAAKEIRKNLSKKATDTVLEKIKSLGKKNSNKVTLTKPEVKKITNAIKRRRTPNIL